MYQEHVNKILLLFAVFFVVLFISGCGGSSSSSDSGSVSENHAEDGNDYNDNQQHDDEWMPVIEGSWEECGEVSESFGDISHFKMDVDNNGYPVVMYQENMYLDDPPSGYYYKLHVKKYDGINWYYLAEPVLSDKLSDRALDAYFDIKLDSSGDPYVFDGKNLCKYQNGRRRIVKQIYNDQRIIDYFAMAMDSDDVPYCAFEYYMGTNNMGDSEHGVKVVQFDGSTVIEYNTESLGISDDSIKEIMLGLNSSGYPAVAIRSYYNIDINHSGYTAHFKSYNGYEWETTYDYLSSNESLQKNCIIGADDTMYINDKVTESIITSAGNTVMKYSDSEDYQINLSFMENDIEKIFVNHDGDVYYVCNVLNQETSEFELRVIKIQNGTIYLVGDPLPDDISFDFRIYVCFSDDNIPFIIYGVATEDAYGQSILSEIKVIKLAE